MWQRKSSSVVVCVVAAAFIIIPGVQSFLGRERDVQGEIDRISAKLSKFEKPNQMMVNSFVEQVQLHCPNRTIDEGIYTNMSSCMEKNFNNTALDEDIREAIPTGKLDEVFHNMCKKWPVAKRCMKELIDVIDDCWSKGDKVNTVMDSMVVFFCGEKNDGERIALFFADGGMRCVEERGDEVKECITKTDNRLDPKKIEKKLDKIDPNNININSITDTDEIPTEEEICKSLKQVHDCAQKGLRKCDDSTPENLVTSMLKVVAKAVDCADIKDYPSRYTGASAQMTISSMIFLPMALLALLHSLTS